MKFYKTLPILLAISVLIVGGVSFFVVPDSPVDECENIFSSGIYVDYHLQLRSFVLEHPNYDEVMRGSTTPFNSQVKVLIQTIEEPLGSNEQQRAVHEKFVTQLRQLALLSSQSQLSLSEQSSKQFLDDLIMWVYLNVDLTSEIQDFFYSLVMPPVEDLSSYLRSKQSFFHEDKRFSGLKYELDMEDGFIHGNLPSVYFSLSNPQATKVIRSGRPITQSLKFPWRTPEVNAEFIRFLELQPNHLYVNLLKRTGSEGKSAKKIEQLEIRIPGVHVVTIDKNSDFYVQDLKLYPESLDSGHFKKLFLEHLTLNNGNYFWSSHMDMTAWKKELSELLDGVHAHYFNGKETLDSNDRRDFIEVAYLEILDRLVDLWTPLSMNISCHQGMDRGPSLLVLWMQKRNQITDREAAALLLAPPLLIHNRASHVQKINRFISASERLMKSKSNGAE